LIEDEESRTSGGLGRAIAGGVLFGGVGAIVGGITGGKKTKTIVKSMKIKITLNSLETPVVLLTLINTPIKTDSIIYKTLESSAQEILGALAVILQQNQAE
jgi:fructose-specific phosphotransferase system IIC component